MCSVQRLQQIVVFGAKKSSGCGFVQKKPQQVVLCAKTSINGLDRRATVG
jgi:hypothetical protein